MHLNETPYNVSLDDVFVALQKLQNQISIVENGWNDNVRNHFFDTYEYEPNKYKQLAQEIADSLELYRKQLDNVVCRIQEI